MSTDEQLNIPTFDSMWESFCKNCVGPEAPPETIKKVKAVFFAGARTIFQAMDAGKAHGLMGAMATADMLHLWHGEIEGFIKATSRAWAEMN